MFFLLNGAGTIRYPYGKKNVPWPLPHIIYRYQFQMDWWFKCERPNYKAFRKKSFFILISSEYISDVGIGKNFSEHKSTKHKREIHA